MSSKQRPMQEREDSSMSTPFITVVRPEIAPLQGLLLASSLLVLTYAALDRIDGSKLLGALAGRRLADL